MLNSTSLKRFEISIKFLEQIKYFLLLLALLTNFETKCGQNGSNWFLKSILESRYILHSFLVWEAPFCQKSSTSYVMSSLLSQRDTFV